MILSLLTFPLNLMRSVKRRIVRAVFLRNISGGVNLKVSTMSKIVRSSGGRISIGENCEINGTLIVQDRGTIQIGNYTTIRYDSVVGAVDSIKIGDCVIISNNIHIYDNNNHPTSPDKREQMCKSGFYGPLWQWCEAASKPVVIEDNVWIGEYSAILKGGTVGKGSIVASHSVVTHDVPPYCIVAGNPARVVKHLDISQDSTV